MKSATAAELHLSSTKVFLTLGDVTGQQLPVEGAQTLKQLCRQHHLTLPIPPLLTPHVVTPAGLPRLQLHKAPALFSAVVSVSLMPTA